MNNKPLSANPDTDKISEWKCPYCEHTRQSLPEIRDHITESTEGEHRGVDGLKPTRDIVAYGTDGEVVERIEGVSTEPADPLDSYSKQEIIINAWLAAERDPDRRAVEAISDASQQYVSRLLNELESGEIPRETYIEVLDYGLKSELEERLEEYEQEGEEGQTMSTEALTAKDIVEDTPKKELIIAAHHVVSDNAAKKDIADALDASYEYVRQIFNDIEDRDPENWEKLREGDLEEEPSESVKNAVRERLRQAGVATTDGGMDELREAAVSESHPSASGTVPASEIDAVLEKLELLQEQAEYTENGDAEFVAKKCIEWLDDLRSQAE
ncbi:hypothetical protein ACERIT_08725 [Halopenitus sp. H-Gu1]|uniref:hypothetical protein n=1 Tax=Halopenitus sp. H-Gu1 TaxID=3242697 RepID=UPI00359E12D9